MTGGIVRALGIVTVLATLATSTPVAAHEYWLDPLDATPDADGTLFAHVRNGEEFVGTSFPFDPRRMARLTLVGPDGATAIDGRLGDLPAVQVALDGPGHHLVVLDTHGKALVYDDLEAFGRFLSYHGLERLLDEHAARALPAADVREIYFRHVKTLVRAGEPGQAPGEPSGDPADGPAEDGGPFAAQGQPLELVPLNDPYRDGRIDVMLLAAGEPLADAQVELFERTPANEVSRRVVTSDAGGRASFDVDRPGDYLLNAVRVSEPGTEALALDGPTPHWESRWASLTFERR